MGVTKSLSINFSIIDISDVTKMYVKVSKSRSYLTGVSAAKLWWQLSNMNVALKTHKSFDNIENKQNNGPEEIGLIPPHPRPRSPWDNEGNGRNCSRQRYVPAQSLAPFQYKDDIPGMRIFIIKIRQSWDCLIFMIGIPILVRWHLPR